MLTTIREKLAKSRVKVVSHGRWVTNHLAEVATLRTLALPDEVERWSMTTPREKPIKIGAKIVRHGRYVTFQMAEVAVHRDLFADIPCLIDGLRPVPLPP